MGARISTGPRNKQDYVTPPEFMEAVTRRFGPISFDLAAHAGNNISPHYYAPVTGLEGPLPLDPEAHGMDAFDHSWAELSKVDFFQEDEGEEVPALTIDSKGTRQWKMAHAGRKGLLWLNPPFNNIPAWASRCQNESLLGANILLLTPASVGSNWFANFVAGFADVYLLNGRLSFIKGEPYNKDCMLSHFYQNSRDRDAVLKNSGKVDWGGWRWMSIWDWRNDKILHRWGFSLSRIDELKTPSTEQLEPEPSPKFFESLPFWKLKSP